MKRVEWWVAKVDRRRGAKTPIDLWEELPDEKTAHAWVQRNTPSVFEVVKLTMETVEKKR